MESFQRQWAMKILTGLVVVFLLVTFTCACPGHSVHRLHRSVSTDPASDVYEKLEAFGFPGGLLPHTVTGYAYEPEADGKFTLFLAGKCQVLVQGKYPLIYNKVITGYLSYGKLQGLKGITVKAFYIWWNIGGIVVGDDDSVFFDIGILSTKFSCSNFEEPPICERRSSVEAAFMDPLFSHFI